MRKQGSHSLAYKKFQDFPGPPKRFPAMFKYTDKQQPTYSNSVGGVAQW